MFGFLIHIPEQKVHGHNINKITFSEVSFCFILDTVSSSIKTVDHSDGLNRCCQDDLAARQEEAIRADDHYR